MQWIIIAVVIIVFLMFISFYLGKAKCPQCKARNAEVISKEKTNSETIYFKEKQHIKEYKNKTGQKQVFDWQTKVSTNKYINAPEKVIEKEVLIPGTRTHYRVCYKCRKCGNTFFRSEYVDEKPTVINN